MIGVMAGVEGGGEGGEGEDEEGHGREVIHITFSFLPEFRIRPFLLPRIANKRIAVLRPYRHFTIPEWQSRQNAAGT